MPEFNRDLFAVNQFFADATTQISAQSAEVRSAIRFIALHGTDEPIRIFKGERDLEVVVFETMAEAHHEEPQLGGFDPYVLKELDTLQRGAEYFAAERQFALSEKSAVEAARRTMRYRGRRDDFGLNDLYGSAERAIRSTSDIIWPAAIAVNEGISNLRAHGVPITVFTPGGYEEHGYIEAVGRMSKYHRPGLGLAIVTRAGDRKIVEVGARNYELKP